MSKDTSPKLLVICQLFYPELISTGQTLTELCEALADKGVEIEVWCAKPSLQKQAFSKKMTHKGITIKRLVSTGFDKGSLIGKFFNHVVFSASVFFKLLFKREKRPILCLTNPPFLSFVIGFIGWIKSLKLLYLVFDVYPESAISLGMLSEKGFIARTWRYFNLHAYRHAHKIIVIGRCMKAVIQNQLPEALHHKLTHIHVWTDNGLIQSIQNTSQENPYLKKWRLEEKFVVLYSGNMARFHDMETFLEAAYLLKNHQQIEFVFIGGGHKRRLVEKFKNSHCLSNCQIHDYVSREDLPFTLNLANVGLVSLIDNQTGYSVPSKSYGLLAAGIPILSVMREDSEIALMIKEQNCGYVFSSGQSQDLANAIETLAENKDHLTTQQDNAIKAAQVYSLDHAAEAYLKLITDLQ